MGFRQKDFVPFYKRPAYLMFLVFLFSSMFLTGAGQLRLVGMILGCFFVYSQTNRFLRVRMIEVPGGIWSYIAWVVVALFIGPMIAKSLPVFWGGIKAAVQSVILIYIVYCVMVRRGSYDEVWCVFLLAVSIHLGAVYLGYDMTKDGLVAGVDSEVTTRVSGLTGNENGLGDFVYLGAFAAFMLWPIKQNMLRFIGRCFLVAFVISCVMVGMRTGSRQTALILLGMAIAWLLFAMPILCKKPGTRILVRIASIICILLASSIVLAYVMTETSVGLRFQEMMDTRSGYNMRDGSMLARMYLYEVGMEIFREHPIFGVGFNQFIVHNSMGLFSHSDYIEPLACTGLIGFCLYHGFALGALLKVLRLFRLRHVMSPTEKYQCRMMLVFITLHYLSGVFAPHWYKLQKVMVVSVIYAMADGLYCECKFRSSYHNSFGMV